MAKKQTKVESEVKPEVQNVETENRSAEQQPKEDMVKITITLPNGQTDNVEIPLPVFQQLCSKLQEESKPKADAAAAPETQQVTVDDLRHAVASDEDDDEEDDGALGVHLMNESERARGLSKQAVEALKTLISGLPL